jgi:hypothetical protein
VISARSLHPTLAAYELVRCPRLAERHYNIARDLQGIVTHISARTPSQLGDGRAYLATLRHATAICGLELAAIPGCETNPSIRFGVDPAVSKTFGRALQTLNPPPHVPGSATTSGHTSGIATSCKSHEALKTQPRLRMTLDGSKLSTIDYATSLHAASVYIGVIQALRMSSLLLHPLQIEDRHQAPRILNLFLPGATQRKSIVAHFRSPSFRPEQPHYRPGFAWTTSSGRKISQADDFTAVSPLMHISSVRRHVSRRALNAASRSGTPCQILPQIEPPN